MADAALAIGHSLGALRSHDIALFSACRLNRRFDLTEHDVDGPLLQDLVGAANLLLPQKLFAKWSKVLRRSAREQSLVHGDFNHGNIVLECKNGRWRVTGILDWELAGTGSSLWDAARFVCYQKPDSHYWESHFLDGFRDKSSAKVPEDWEHLSLVMNTLSAAVSLARGSAQERFVPELKRLIHCGLRGEKIG